MRNFIFYSKTDSTREPIGKIQASTEEEAVEIAAQKKQLTIDSFLELFEVKEIKNK
jgi:hypothetical protein